MPNVKTHTFGPGSLESLTLKTWVGKRDGANRRFHTRLTGTYAVYCGMGGEHQVEVDESHAVWASTKQDDLMQEINAILTFTTFSDPGREAAYTVAGTLLSYAIEDFEDPCEDDGEEM